MSGLQAALYSANRTQVERDEPTATDTGLTSLSLLEPDAGAQRQDSREPHLPPADDAARKINASPAPSRDGMPCVATSPTESSASAQLPDREAGCSVEASASPIRERSIGRRGIIVAALLTTIGTIIVAFVLLSSRVLELSTGHAPIVPTAAPAASLPPRPAASTAMPPPSMPSPSTPSASVTAVVARTADEADAEELGAAPKAAVAHNGAAASSVAPRASKRSQRARGPLAEATRPHVTPHGPQIVQRSDASAIEPSMSKAFAETVPTLSPPLPEAGAAVGDQLSGTRNGSATVQQGTHETASAAYADSPRHDMHDVDAVFELATIAAVSGRRGEALDRFQEALRIDPRHIGAAAGLLSLIARDNPHRAEQTLLQAIAQSPAPPLYFALGNVYAMLADWRRARVAYTHALALLPGNADYAYNLAISHEHLAQPRQALEHYRAALASVGTTAQPSFDLQRVQQRIAILERHVDSR